MDSFTSRSILVLDAEKRLRDLIKLVLESAGHEVTTASEGVEGLRLASERPFQLVIVGEQLEDVERPLSGFLASGKKMLNCL